MALEGGASHVERRGLRASSQLELLVYVAEIILDGLIAQAKGSGDFLVGFPVGHQGQDPLLLGSDRLGMTLGGLGRGGSHPCQERLSDGRVENGPSSCDGLNRMDQGLASDLFE